MSKIRTFVKTIFLDTVFNRKTQDFSTHWAGTTVKGFKVLSTNNDAFDLTFTADPDDGSIEGLPLGDVRVHNYNQIANNGVFENSIIQAGVYVKVLISVEDPIIDTSSKSKTSSSVVVSDGTNHSSARVDLPLSTTTLIIPADDSRSISVLQLKSGATFWIGNPAELASGDYKNICQSITLAAGDFFEWRNAGALYAKTDVSACVFSHLKEVK